MAFNEKSRGNLKDMVRSKGSTEVTRILKEALEKGELLPDEMSLKEIWDAYTEQPGTFPMDKMEAITSGDLTTVTGSLIHSKIIDGYNQLDLIGDRLVTVVPSKVKTQTVAGFTDTEGVEEVAEHEPYPYSGFEDKFVTIKNKKFGRLIDITEEAIMMDQTHQVLDRARKLGRSAALLREKTILQAVQDVNSEAYWPSNTATALYSANNANLASTNPFNAAGLAAVKKLAHQMKGDGNDPDYVAVILSGQQILVPVDLEEEAWELAHSTGHPETAERADNYWKGQFEVLSSPYITEQSSTTWYWGNFKENFWLTDVWPLQTFSARPGNLQEIERDIRFIFKTRLYFGVGAVDYRYVFKSTAA